MANKFLASQLQCSLISFRLCQQANSRNWLADVQKLEILPGFFLVSLSFRTSRTQIHPKTMSETWLWGRNNKKTRKTKKKSCFPHLFKLVHDLFVQVDALLEEDHKQRRELRKKSVNGRKQGQIHATP